MQSKFIQKNELKFFQSQLIHKQRIKTCEFDHLSTIFEWKCG